MATSPGATGIHAVSRQTLGDHVYEQVRDAIMRGEIAGGTEINQVELAGQLGVSRVPVREALRRLQAERLVEANPFQRFVVTKLSDEQVIELFDLRAELETFAALRAREREDFVTSDLLAARAAADALEIEMSPNEWIEADMDFHRTVNGRESAVTMIIDEIRFRIYRYLHMARPDVERRAQVILEHTAILAAIEHGDDAAVREAITAHIGGTRDRLTLLGSRAIDIDTDTNDD